MPKALQQLWVRRGKFGLIAVVLITSALVLTLTLSLPDAPANGHLAIALPASVFALLAPTSGAVEKALYEELAASAEPYLLSSFGRAPPA